MSHMCVTVFLPGSISENDLQDAVDTIMQPYHEYECTGEKDKYVVLVDRHDEYVDEYNDYKKEGQTLDDYVTDGFSTDWRKWVQKVNDRWHRWTNPNKKWDWFSIGGRYADRIKLKNQGYSTNVARLKDIDFDGMLRENRSHYVSPLEECVADVCRLLNCSVSDAQAKIVEYQVANWDLSNKWRASDKAGNRDNFQTWYQKQTGVYNLDTEAGKRIDKLFGYAGAGFPLNENPFKYVDSIPALWTFAYVDETGWNERGEMGWFASVSNEMDQNDWNAQVTKRLESLNENDWVIVVDCHI